MKTFKDQNICNHASAANKSRHETFIARA